jgi:hypothetical protein
MYWAILNETNGIIMIGIYDPYHIYLSESKFPEKNAYLQICIIRKIRKFPERIRNRIRFLELGILIHTPVVHALTRIP